MSDGTTGNSYVGINEAIEKPSFFKKGILIIFSLGILLVGGFISIKIIKEKYFSIPVEEKKVVDNNKGRSDLGLPTTIPSKPTAPITPTEAKVEEAQAPTKPTRPSMMLSKKQASDNVDNRNTASVSGTDNKTSDMPKRVNPYLSTDGGMLSPEKAIAQQQKTVEDMFKRLGIGGGTGGADSAPALGGMGNATSQQLNSLSNNDAGQGARAALNRAKYNSQNYTLNAGSFIPCILMNEIISTVPGDSVCLVSKDIYSSNGLNLLIPKYSKLLGAYKSDVGRGDERIANYFDRLDTTDGMTLRITAQGVGNSGAAGIEADVDNKWVSRIGGAVLLALFQDGISFGSQQLAYNQYLRESWRKEDADAQRTLDARRNVTSTTTTTKTIDPVTGKETSITTTSAPPSNSGTSNFYGSTSTNQVNPPVWGTDASRATMRSIADNVMQQQANVKPVARVKKGTEIQVYVKDNLNFEDVYKNTVTQTLVKRTQ